MEFYPDLLLHLIQFVDAKTFHSLLLTSKSLYHIIKPQIPIKRKQLLRHTCELETGLIHFTEYYLLPNGKKEGEYREWYINGNLASLCYYVDGKCEGKVLHWYHDGTLMTECNYVEDKRHGIYTYYIEGEVVNQMEYDHGCIMKTLT